ncbi:MAG: CapA family protein [Ignavibacteriales bacterium]
MNSHDGPAGGRTPGSISIVAAGDSVITQTMSSCPGQDLLALREIIRAADVRFTNLEVLFNDGEGYPSAESGGTWLSAEPYLIEELKWLGFNLYACANNHTMDWSWDGLRRHLMNLDRAGVVHAGAGKDAGHARIPAYLETAGGRVALISLTTTIPNSGRAGEARQDCQGRPGVNTLRHNRSGYHKLDAARILTAIGEARSRADWVLCSVHSHEHPRGALQSPVRFQIDFCRASVDAGADAVICHGPHVVRAIEIYHGKPILHGLGNFIFQIEPAGCQPADFYEELGLGDSATLADALDARNAAPRWAFLKKPTCWESIVPVWRYEGGALVELKVYPVSLGFGLPTRARGRPAMAGGDQARRIIDRVGCLSRSYGLEIEFMDGIGVAKW